MKPFFEISNALMSKCKFASKRFKITQLLWNLRSWQGFGAAHRTARQQAFFESKRYENQVTDSSLPPPPSFTPNVAISSSSSMSTSSPNIDACPSDPSSGMLHQYLTHKLENT